MEDRIGERKKTPRGILEVGNSRVQHREIKVRPQKTPECCSTRGLRFLRRQVPFRCAAWLPPACQYGFGPTQKRAAASGEEARSIGSTGQVIFEIDRHAGVGGLTLAWLAVGRAEAVAILGNLEGGPVEFGQARNKPGDD